MTKQTVKRIKEIKAQMAQAKAYGDWNLFFDLDKSLGILIATGK